MIKSRQDRLEAANPWTGTVMNGDSEHFVEEGTAVSGVNNWIRKPSFIQLDSELNEPVHTPGAWSIVNPAPQALYEGDFIDDRRMFDFEEPGDY